MALGTPYNLGTINTKNSTTEVVTTGTAVAAGDTVFIAFMTATTYIISSVVDNSGGGNTYNLVSRVNLNNVLSNGTLHVYAADNHSGMASGSTITVTATTTVLMCASAWAVSGISAASLVSPAVTAFGSSTAPTATKTGLSSTQTYLSFGIVGTGGPAGDTFTQVSGFATPPVRVGSTGGSAATNRTLAGGWDNFTGATSEVYNPTLGTSRTWGEILLVYTAAAITINETITESGNALESQTRNISVDSANTESVTASDAQDAEVVKDVDITESVTATDSQDAVTPANADITEAVSASDAETAINDAYASITESVTATATQDGSVLADAAITEAVTATETETAIFSTSASQTESVTATETQAEDTTKNAVISESVTATETETSQLDANADITESVLALDSESASKEYNVDEAESVTATDDQIAGLAQDVSQDETVTATGSEDATTATTSAITETVSASDAETAVDTARAWITESNNTFGSTPPVYDTAITYADFTSTTVLGSVFVARASGTVKTVSIFGRRGATYTSGSIDVQIWQLASNSPSALPQTLLGTVSVPYTAVNGGAGAQTTYLLDISTANASLVSGTYYAVVLRNSTLSSTFYWSNYTTEFNPITVPYSIAAGVVSAAVFFNGTSWSSNSNGFLPATVYLTNNTADTQASTYTTPAAITESVIATDEEDAVYAVAVNQDESVTATDTEDGIVAFNSFVTESVTASDAETNVLTARAWINEGDIQQNTIQGFTASASTTSTSSGIKIAQSFVANKSGVLGNVSVGVYRASAANPLPSGDGTVELWQLDSNSVSGVPQTLLDSVPMRFSILSTSSSNIANYYFGNVSLTQGVGYAIVIVQPSGVSASTSYIGWSYTGASLSNPTEYNYLAAFNSGYRTNTTGVWNAPANRILKVFASLVDAADEQLPGLSYQVAQDEAALALDSENAVFALPVDITETVTATDTEDSNAAMGVAQNEAVTATDTQDGSQAQNSYQTETVTATDTETTTADYAVNQTETVTATDTETTTAAFQAYQTESVTATESNVVYVDFTAAITETLSLTDSQLVVAVLPVYITEAVAANDSCVAESSAIFTVTGVQGTTQLGTATVATDQILSVTGVQATGYLGTATTIGTAVVNLTGVQGTTQLGTATVSLDQYVNVTSVTAQGAVGTISLVTNNFINVTGVQGATQLGTATAFTNNTVNVTGVQATSAIGNVSITIGQFINVSGVQANIILNKVNVWGDIVPTPTGPWSNVNDSQTNNWVIIDKAA